jgi:Protein of unknown function (DUF3489)
MNDTTNAKPTAKRPRKMAREPRADAGADAVTTVMDAAPQPMVAYTKPQTKTAQVEALLSREEGASPGDLCKTTGWLPHTVRAFLTGLRKKGRAIERIKLDGETRYTIALAIAP